MRNTHFEHLTLGRTMHSSVSILADASAIAEKQLIFRPTAETFHPKQNCFFYVQDH
jgi:hypothetical protein